MYYSIMKKLVNLYYRPLWIRKFLANSDNPPFLYSTYLFNFSNFNKGWYFSLQAKQLFLQTFCNQLVRGGVYRKYFEGGGGLYITWDEASWRYKVINNIRFSNNQHKQSFHNNFTFFQEPQQTRKDYFYIWNHKYFDSIPVFCYKITNVNFQLTCKNSNSCFKW